MSVPTLAEHGEAVSIPLDDATGQALVSSGLVDAAPDAYKPGQWRVKARSLVGVARVDVPGGRPVTLRIVPKVPIRRLLFLLGYSRNPKGWRDGDVQLAEDQELVPALARLFVRQAEHALQPGMLRGYRVTEETTLLVRGRIREADQIRRQHGRLLPVEIVHDEFTTDIAENQLLRTAGERLWRLPAGVPDEVRGRLLRLRVRLADVTPIRRGHELPAWRPTRLNSRYHSALRLAELVLRGTSVEHRPGEVTVTGFLFDMAKVFEDFVTVVLREALADVGGWCRLQATHHLDEREAIRMVPDFVRYAEDGAPVAVADAKYKAERPAGFPDADLYQMLAYCTALGLPEGHLVYAKGGPVTTSHRVRHAGIVLHQHVLDLDQSPDRLLKQVRALAQRLSSR